MDNTQKRIGCYLGDKEGSNNGSRTKIIDPNAFYSELDSSRNIPVNLEDLNISVKLTTRKKSRTTIFSDSSTSEAQIKEQEGVTINFIEGSDINGKKVLTTRFTELTTVFEKDTFNPETFGITNIDIDFNTSYTPMIKIDFVDVRGSSIFQNEANLLNNETDNKYGVFFEFPYPLFELEIKGYYGQPVTYCLHMLKFNSKFNSQTGNFEISCEFIGYTYAMLSDMLVGVLKAIPFTTIGEKVFQNYNNARKIAELPPILDLVDLRVKIAQISSEIQKFGETTEQAKVLKTFDEANIILDTIKIKLFSLNDALGIPTKSTETLPETIFVVLSGNSLTQTQQDSFNRINEEIKTSIKNLNNLKIQGLYINENDIANPIRLTNLNLNKLEPNFDFQLPFGSIKTSEELEKFKIDLKNYINSYYTMSSEKIFSVYDLRSRFKLIEDKRTLLTDSEEQIKKSLALEIKDKIKVTLGFEPTVRNMVEIFTTLIEVFIETLYEVSSKAETYPPRKELFDTVFSDNIRTDYLSEDIRNKVNYYPWPDYSEKEDSKAYVDKYLGSNPQIKGRTFDVPELEFIDNLLQAFLKASEKESQAELLIADSQTLFIPCNPLDTSLYTQSINPYAKTEIIKTDQAFRMFLIRAMTFLGYTNNQNYLTKGEDGEIQKMAKIEAQTLFQAIINPQVKLLMKDISLESILAVKGNVSGSDRSVVKLSGNDYFYNYAAEGSGNVVKLLPVGFDLNGKNVTILTNETAHPRQKGMTDFASDGNIFLTNYSSGYGGSGLSVDNFKYDDGGIYIDIKSPDDYLPPQDATLIDTTIGTESVLDLKSLQDGNIESAGFNSFGGSYGIQDFNTIDFGLPNNPLSMYIFYNNKPTKNGLALPRTEGLTTSYDFNKDGFNLYGKRSGKESSQSHYSNDSLIKTLHLQNGENRSLASVDKVTYPYVNYQLDYTDGLRLDVYNIDIDITSSRTTYLPLFGSEFYYLQKNAKITLKNNDIINNVAEYYVKGLLFLNTIPFNIEYKNEDPFNREEIKRLFDVKGGFIHAPRLWAAYVGGLLWWLSKEDPDIVDGKIIGGGRGKNDPIIWKHTCNTDDSKFKAPKDNQYLPKNLLGDRNDILENSYLITMPRQVKDKFKQVFFDFINGDKDIDFKKLADKLEIYKGSPNQFCDIVKFLTKTQTAQNNNTGAIIAQNSRLEYNGSSITNNLVNYENYKIILPVDETKDSTIGLKYIFLEIDDKVGVNQDLVKSFVEEIIIVNTGVNIWLNSNPFEITTDNVLTAVDFLAAGNIVPAAEIISSQILDSTVTNNELRVPIKVNKEIFEEYVKAFTETMSGLTKDITIQGEEERRINEVFGSTNKDEIKLMLYRHCKNIYDKWIGGVSVSDKNNVAGNILFQCGGNRQIVDKNLATRDGHTTPRLIHSFRFVTRSFKDIGDELFINPTPIENQISDFPNTSAYNVISGLLSDNKFNFIALPSFIDYRDDKMLESVFTPYSTPYDGATCGPTFVCTYIGQSSKRLDIVKGRYPNDGFDMRCTNGTPDTSIPDDFNAALQDYEDPIAVFEVNYSQQNQNIFKDVVLDQSEFTETEESLKIVQDISTKGFENNPSFAGQNMYNVYAVRSYSAEIEMLGNAMIQPMMYFQLNNIPMFHGAYMIIRTRHNIKPNHMTTWFTGTRIRAIETPIIDATEAYMNLVETLDLSKASSSSSASVAGSTPKSSPPIIQTLINNGVSASDVNKGRIRLCEIKAIKGVSFELKPNKQMICEAVEPFTKMLTDWVSWMISERFKPIKTVGNEKIYVYVTSMFRTEGSNSAHSFGIAVDFQMANKNGIIIPNNAGIDSNGNKKIFSLPEYFNFEYNPALKWLYNNSYRYGFVQPYWANDGKGSGNNSEEHWHWEYHGKSAICMLRQQPIPGLGNNKQTDNPLSSISENKIFNFVKNPLEPDGNEAIYNDCTYKTTATVTDKYNKIDDESSTITKKEDIIVNQIAVKNYLKGKGLTKSQVAGIMGNIHKETGGKFDPLSVNKKDINDYPSVGLIQWNGLFTPRGGSKDSNVILSTIGKTVNEQLTYLTTKSNEYRTWLNLPNNKNTKTSAYDAAFEFARLVEICTGCDTEQNYKTSKFKPYERSLFANDYFNRFDDPKDRLYW